MRKVAAISLIVCVALFYAAFVKADDLPVSSWSSPSQLTIKRVSAVGNPQKEANFLNNLDCQLATYRFVSSQDMRTGCFTSTAFGQFDSDSQAVIYNGTDEALPLLPYSAHQVLAPWNQALNLIALDAANTGGSYISMYKNPLAKLQDVRNAFGVLTAKQLTGPPELSLLDSDGQKLIINSQTITVSDGGSWLIAETLTGSFVRINLATLQMTKFAAAYGSQGSPGLLKSNIAVTDNGKYVAIRNASAESFKVYDLSKCTSLTICASHEYWPSIQSRIPDMQNLRHIRIINDSLLSFEVTAGSESNSGVYLMSPAARIDSLTDYIALGDSYTSGEGAFDYVSGTDTSNNKCHLSLHSYPLLLTKDLFTSSGGHSVACSGAVNNDIASQSSSYRGQAKDGLSLIELQENQPLLLETLESNFTSGYIAQHRFIKRWQPKFITVSIGGNDIGFGKMIQQCAMPRISVHLSDSTCFNTYEDRMEVLNLIDRTVPKWTVLYRQLRAESPASKIYAVGYPDIVDDTGSCAVNVHMGKSELEFATELVVYINKSVQKAAGEAGVTYIDISKALAGHRLCETASHNVAVNGLTAGNDRLVFGSESYHPNALGHQLIEQAILEQTNNFIQAVPMEVLTSSPALLNVPKSGRSLSNRWPATITSEKLRRGTTAVIQFNSSGLYADTVYQVRIDGPSGPIAGTATTNSEGNITSSVTVPPATSSGGHTIDIIGNDQTGHPVDVTQPVYVPENDNDGDADGLDDSIDSCPNIGNAGLDVDHDGIDDACDPLIGQPPAPSTSGPIQNGALISSATIVTSFVSSNVEDKGVLQASSRISLGGKTFSLGQVSSRNFLPPIKQNNPSVINSRKNFKINPYIIWWLPLLLIPLAMWVFIILLKRFLSLLSVVRLQ